MKYLKTLCFLFMAALFVAVQPAASAATLSFTGVFTTDDQVDLFHFTVDTPGLVGLTTTSYVGGGFSPVFSLFDEQNNHLLIGRDNGVDNGNGEADFNISLGVGRYILALTQFDNLARGPRLADGFLRQGDPTFTREFGAPGATGPFLDIDGQQRNGNFTFTLTNVATAAPIPEPSTLLLVSVGMGGLLLGIRRRG